MEEVAGNVGHIWELVRFVRCKSDTLFIELEQLVLNWTLESIKSDGLKICTEIYRKYLKCFTLIKKLHVIS